MTGDKSKFLDLLKVSKQRPKEGDTVAVDILLAQQKCMVRNSGPLAVIHLANTVIVAVVLWTVANPLWLFGWLALATIVSGAAFKSYLRFRNRPEPTRVSGRFLERAETHLFFVGLLWGSIGFLFEARNPELLMFLILVCVGMSAGFTVMVSPLPRVAFRFSCGALGPLVLLCFLQQSSFFTAIGLLNIVLVWALGVGSLQSYDQLREQVAARSDAISARSTLFDAIEATNDAFALHDSSGTLMIANSRYADWFPDYESRKPPEPGVRADRRLDDGRWVIASTETTRGGDRVTVFSDVTDLKTRERELIAARLEAEKADEAKSRFLATMSHELRTPLNIILGFSRLMTSGSNIPMTETDWREYADNIHTSGDHLLNLINDIIEYSKLGLEKYLIKPEPVDLRAMLARSVKLSAGFTNLTDVKDISVSVSPSMGGLVVDEIAFQRILISLLTNAMKFCNEDKRIIVKAALREDGSPYIAIRDFGIGIPKEEHEKVFEAFYQHDPDLNRNFGGTGLGLTLCRHLARIHGGDIILKSRPGVGTTVTVVLPPETHIPREVARATASAA